MGWKGQACFVPHGVGVCLVSAEDLHELLFFYSSPAKNASLKKSLQFDTNAFESGSEGTSSENSEASASSLSNLIGMIAETSEDKYRLLDQRDKIMRQGKKMADIFFC